MADSSLPPDANRETSVGWGKRSTGNATAEVSSIKADPSSQRRLLDLQAVDSAVAQLQHRRRTLPEHAELARLQAEQRSTESDLVAADTAVSDLELEQTKAESDLEPVRQRLVRNQQRIADGSIADAKALASMVAEVDHLKKRIGDLEDAELEVMEQLESAVAAREKLRARARELRDAIAQTTERRDEQVAALDAEIAQRQTERGEVAPQIDAALLGLYAKVAASHGGVGAAELRMRRCTGCQLQVNAADLGTFAAAADDEVLRCEECSRILVRTAQSGL
jgi:predicted  nucleic acid-binding Zn-ribbon protein